MLRQPGACSGEAVQHKILQPQMVSELFLVVALSMAITPFLASLGQRLGKAFEKSDMSVRTSSHSSPFLHTFASSRVSLILHSHFPTACTREQSAVLGCSAALVSTGVLRCLALLQHSAGGLSPDVAVLCSSACFSVAAAVGWHAGWQQCGGSGKVAYMRRWCHLLANPLTESDVVAMHDDVFLISQSIM